MRGMKVAKLMRDILKDPEGTLPEIIQLADELGADGRALRQFVAEMEADPVIAPRLAAKARLGRLDLAAMQALPEGTLGRVFADHMADMGFDPEDLPIRPHTDSLTYVKAHLFETHDLWHVLTGFDTSVDGELGLQAFYLAQVGGPLAAMLLGGATLKTLAVERDQLAGRIDAMGRGWAMGRQAAPLLAVDWVARWERPLSEVRAEFGIPDLAGTNRLALAA